MGHVLQHCLFALFTISLGGYFFIASLRMPRTASLFPKIIAALVIGLSLAMIAQAVSALRKKKPTQEEIPTSKLEIARVAVAVALIATYIYLIPRIGYFVATPLFMVVSYAYLRAMSIRKAALVSLGFCVFIYLLFVWFLKLPIPMGYLEPLSGS